MSDMQHRFGSSDYEPNLKGLLQFEMKSLIGRAFSRRRRQPRAPLLQLGCGSKVRSGVENVDFYSLRRFAGRLFGAARAGHFVAHDGDRESSGRSSGGVSATCCFPPEMR